jgi:ABC-type multidrug transport system ATPase subunit
MATQTVTEALSFAAALKMNFSPQMRSDKVSEMLSLLGLSGSENTIIGDSSMKGVSGGERKRVAVGMQLITDPSLLFLDEPTSGLDTLNAFNVVSTLKKLALKGKTVVATLHQPSSEIFHMIDDLIVMAAGEIVYCGPANAVVSYFATLGFNCPMYATTPFLHYIIVTFDQVQQPRRLHLHGRPKPHQTSPARNDPSPPRRLRS